MHGPNSAGENQVPLVLLKQEPEIVLTWLVRLRWLAAAGQVFAVALARWGLGLEIAAVPIGCVIAATLLSNLLLVQVMRRRVYPAGLVPAVILLDVLLLTALLYFSGGATNPFAILYIIHIVMAVVVLGAAWTWLIAAIACIAFGMLLFFHRPLTVTPRTLSPTVAALGQWAAFALVAALIGYFVGRVALALRQREQELSATRERATRSEQLASLSTLAAGAAHELGTPLGTIAIVAKELELASAGNGFVQDDARLIRQEVDRCRAILDRMRVDIIEDLRQKVTRVPLEELIERLRSGFEEERRRRLTIRSVQPLTHVTGPVRAIEQAVHVLLGNAFDASAEDAQVTLDIRRHEGATIFTVEDRGSGMSEDVRRQAGRPFFTTKPQGKGMGLGLFLVRMVAERYGGRFELSSAEGVGTKSTLVIPEADNAAADGGVGGA